MSIQSSIRPESVKMKIHTGMLESLGLNMYTSIAKSLVEFIANGFDADATEVKVTMPSDAIQKARTELKEATKKAVADGKQEKANRIYAPLPDSIEITIEDNGHGMTIDDLENKFLIVNRNRRDQQGAKSESGLRAVMGRKGLGKLAGFGVAEQVVIWTKRKGETYATTLHMNYSQIKQCETIGDVDFSPQYDDDLDPKASGTKITLKKLRCDSVRSKEDKLEDVLARNFFMMGEDFKLHLNDALVKDPEIDYEFSYPPKEKQDKFGLAEIDVKVDETFTYPIRAVVKFRAPNKEQNDGKQRGSLPAALRGARVYCNKRLAAGPTLFNLETGMHNFHAQSYMECIVHADVLDQLEADLIGTNRSGLKTDNEVVDRFVETVTGVMRSAIYEHSKFRSAQAEKEIQEDPTSVNILKQVSQLSRKTQKPAKALLMSIAASHGIDSAAYKEVAPLVVKAINSSEVLIELVKTGINPGSLGAIIDQLQELSVVEKRDVLKIYRGRRNAINGLQLLEERSHGKDRKPRYENELQDLLKKNPWLIKSEYGNHLSSDAKMGEVARKINAKLGIDSNTKSEVKIDKEKRPDLVFVLVDPNPTVSVCVVELKSPNVDLDNDHLTQLEGYMMDVEAIIKADHGSANVTGYLIGNLAKPDTQAQKSKLLKKKIDDAGPNTKWAVKTIPDLLKNARLSHQNAIEALEAEEEEEDGLVATPPMIKALQDVGVLVPVED
jgi:hypothetical protein